MTFYDDPNREAVGLEPIWTGAEVEVGSTKAKKTAAPAPDPVPEESPPSS